MKIASKGVGIARVFLGLAFVVFGLNGFLQFIPMPAPPEKAGAFLGALAATGYMFPLIKGTELFAGLALLSGRFVPLALTVLAPVVLHIVAYHAALAPAGLGLPVVLAALGIYLAYAYRGSFRSVLEVNARPTVAASEGAELRTADTAAE